MAISHFFRCFGCGKEHRNNFDAIVCCAVCQEIFRCQRCGEELPTEGQAERHNRKCTATDFNPEPIGDPDYTPQDLSAASRITAPPVNSTVYFGI